MFSTNDPTIMALLVNHVFQTTKEPHLLVEKIDQSVSQTLGLPTQRRLVFYMAATWGAIAKLIWIGQIAGKSRKMRSNRPALGQTGTAGFEASRRQAVDRANSWSVPKTGRSKFTGANLGVEHSRVQPIEPLLTCGEMSEQGESASSPKPEKAAASASASEEHPAWETAGTRR